MAGILETLVEWLVSVSQWFNGWDITLLVPALIILTVIAGVTGRAATGPRLWMQLAWGMVTVILGLIEVAIIWTIIARYLPVADMGTLIQNALQHKPLFVSKNFFKKFLKPTSILKCVGLRVYERGHFKLHRFRGSERR